MAKKMRRILVLCLVLVFSISMIATPAMAKDNNNQSSSTQTEWYQVIVNGSTVASASGSAGDHTWLVQGVYSWNVSVSGTTMSWRAGKHSGSVNLANYISIPDGYEIAEGGYTVEHKSVEGVNSQSANFDNAIITVTISALYNPVTGETVPVEPEPTDPPATEPPATEPPATEPPATEPPATEPPATEPPATEPPATEPPATEPPATEPPATEPPATEPQPVETKVTVIHEYNTHDVYTGETTEDGTVTEQTDVTEGDEYTATPKPDYDGNTYTQQPGDVTIIIKADEKDNVIVIEYVRIIDTTLVDYAPALSVIKTAAQTTYKEGETVSWTITVKNTGAYTAYDVVITDDLTGDRWSIAALAPGAEQSFTTTLENAPAGNIKNVAVVSWTDNDEIPDEKEPEETKTTSDDEIVVVEEPVNYTPVLHIEKIADKAVYEAGETITWTIGVMNVSGHTAYNVVVTDELTGDTWTIDSLAPFRFATFTATTENAAPGSVKNVAVVTWEDGDEIPDEEEPNEIRSTSDDEIVSIKDPAPENYTPVLSVVKTAGQETYKEGEAITWTITVKNVSDYTAYNVVIVDELAKGYWTIDSLAPGAQQSFTATMENVAAGSVKNVVVTTWKDGDDIPDEEEPNEIKETSDEEVVIVEEPENYAPVLSIVKTADKSVYKIGDMITWTIRVKNVSEYTAYDVVITDEMADASWTIDSLAPGAEQLFVVTTNAAAEGTVKNVVVATWDDGDEIPTEEEIDEPKTVTDDEIVEVKKPEPVNPDPIVPDPVDPDPTEPEPTEPETPETPMPLTGEVEIPDEEVPLAEAPKTGDISILWVALSGISAGGMIVLGKKREDEEE